MSTRGMLAAVALATAIAGAVACGGRDQAGNGPAVMLTGCLEPGDKPNTFRLAAVGSPNGATGTTGGHRPTQQENPTGTASKSESSDIGAATTRVYTLIPTEKANLSMHEGTMVQVSGQLQSNDAASGSNGVGNSGNRSSGDQGQAAGGQGTSGTTDANGNRVTGTGSNSFAQGQTADRAAATLRVDSVKRVSGSCGDTR